MTAPTTSGRIASETPVARPAFTEILRESAYRRLWISGLCVNTARWMDLVVLGWLALQLTGSPFMVGLAVFSRDVLKAGPEWLGGLVAADGLGSLLGALTIASRRGFIAHRRLFVGAVLIAPLLLIAFSGMRWRWACVALLVVIGVAESGFATMQSTLVLLAAPEERRGGVMGILSACIGTQPLGTLWLGFLATGIGVAPAIAVNSLLAFLAIASVAVPLGRRAPRREPAPT